MKSFLLARTTKSYSGGGGFYGIAKLQAQVKDLCVDFFSNVKDRWPIIFQILIAWVSMCQQDVVWKHWVEQSVIMGPVERGAPLLSEWVGNWPGAGIRLLRGRH